MQNETTNPLDANTIVCPSGLTGTVRGLKVREERILADRRLAKTGKQMDALLSACWLDTTDPGPYALDGKPPQWENILQGDRFYALLKIRAFTYGDTYSFSVTCANDSCRKRIDWSLSLVDLPLRPLPPESRQAFAEGNRFEVRLPSCGNRVWYQLATGAHEQRLAQLRDSQPDRLLSAMLSLRVLEVEGVPALNKRAFLEDLSMRDANFLVSHFESVDCGVDTAIEIECPACLHVQGLDLPLDPSFLWPSNKNMAGSSRPAA